MLDVKVLELLKEDQVRNKSIIKRLFDLISNKRSIFYQSPKIYLSILKHFFYT